MIWGTTKLKKPVIYGSKDPDEAGQEPLSGSRYESGGKEAFPAFNKTHAIICGVDFAPMILTGQ